MTFRDVGANDRDATAQRRCRLRSRRAGIESHAQKQLIRQAEAGDDLL